MAAVRRGKKKNAFEEQQLEIRDKILDGLNEIKKGNIKDFNEVCARLENQYKDAAIHD